MEEIKIGSGERMGQEQMEEYNKQAHKDYNEKALEKCSGCGRTFLPDRLIVH